MFRAQQEAPPHLDPSSGACASVEPLKGGAEAAFGGLDRSVRKAAQLGNKPQVCFPKGKGAGGVHEIRNKEAGQGDSLAVQWLGHHAFTAGFTFFAWVQISWGTKIPQAMWQKRAREDLKKRKKAAAGWA